MICHVCIMTYSHIDMVLPKDNTLQHAATQCDTLQHTATRCNTLRHAATHCNTLQYAAIHCNTPQHTATHCNTLQHTCNHAQIDMVLPKGGRINPASEHPAPPGSHESVLSASTSKDAHVGPGTYEIKSAMGILQTDFYG